MKKKLDKISDELDGASKSHKKQSKVLKKIVKSAKSKALAKSSKLHKRQAKDLRSLRTRAVKKALSK